MRTAVKKIVDFDTPETMTGSAMTGRMPSKKELAEMAALVAALKEKKSKKNYGKLSLPK